MFYGTSTGKVKAVPGPSRARVQSESISAYCLFYEGKSKSMNDEVA